MSHINGNGIYWLSGRIEDKTIKPAAEWLLQQSLSPDRSHVTLFINSGGGDVYEAFALTDLMECGPIAIHTVGIGYLCSAATLIACAGAKGHRILTPNTNVMTHVFTGGSYGKEHDLVAQQRQHDLTSRRMTAHYQRHTGLNKSDVRKHILPVEDRFMTAQQARKFGLCDHVRKWGGA